MTSVNNNNNNKDEPGPVELPLGKIVANKYVILQKLGEGGFGAVYRVYDVVRKEHYALKAETRLNNEAISLKQESFILLKLTGIKLAAQFIELGKRNEYYYMVTKLFGPSLSSTFKFCKREFSASTQVRLAYQMIKILESIHSAGILHRDVKPANFVFGRDRNDSKTLFAIDFGLARTFAYKSNGKYVIRKPRVNTSFRGTTKYCSVNASDEKEQGCHDDLISILYCVAEMRGPLPWENLIDDDQILKIKKETTDEKLLSKCPTQMIEIAAHLRELDYYKRPDYAKIYRTLDTIMKDMKIQHSDLFDWEKISCAIDNNQIVFVPSETVSFQSLTPSLCSVLAIKNKWDRAIIFKMKTTRPLLFKMNPVYGIIEKGEEKQVRLILKERINNEKPPCTRDRFTMIIAPAPEGCVDPSKTWREQKCPEVLTQTARKVLKIEYGGPDNSKLVKKVRQDECFSLSELESDGNAKKAKKFEKKKSEKNEEKSKNKADTKEATTQDASKTDDVEEFERVDTGPDDLPPPPP